MLFLFLFARWILFYDSSWNIYTGSVLRSFNTLRIWENHAQACSINRFSVLLVLLQLVLLLSYVSVFVVLFFSALFLFLCCLQFRCDNALRLCLSRFLFVLFSKITLNLISLFSPRFFFLKHTQADVIARHYSLLIIVIVVSILVLHFRKIIQ